MPFVTIALARVPQCNSTRYEGGAFADLWLGYQLNCAYDESGGGIWTSVTARVSSAAREIGTGRSESEASFITLISVQRLSLHVSDPELIRIGVIQKSARIKAYAEIFIPFALLIGWDTL